MEANEKLGMNDDSCFDSSMQVISRNILYWDLSQFNLLIVGEA
jgi:hypothetical protein